MFFNRFRDCLYDPLHTSGQRVDADSLRSNSCKITFCGFRTKNETCSEGCIWHPIKATLYQKTIFIDKKHFYENFFPLCCKFLTLLTHKRLHRFDYNKKKCPTNFCKELLTVKNQRQLADHSCAMDHMELSLKSQNHNALVFRAFSKH